MVAIGTVDGALELQLAVCGQKIHAFLDRLPGQLKGGRMAQLREECAALLADAPQNAGERWTRVCNSLTELRAGLDRGAAKAYLLARYEEAARAYEHWVAAHRTDKTSAPAPATLQPLKGARTWFHMAMATTATVLYQFFLTREQALIILLVLFGLFGTLEVTRRLWSRWNHLLVTSVFKAIARPREYYAVNSATWYLGALCLLTPLFSKAAMLAGVLILGFGDPAAAWIGRKWGTKKLYRKKSYAGTSAFIAAGFIVAGAYLLAFHPALPLGRRLIAAAAASVLGSIAELFSDRLDDNLTVPIAAVLGAAIFV